MTNLMMMPEMVMLLSSSSSFVIILLITDTSTVVDGAAVVAMLWFNTFSLSDRYVAEFGEARSWRENDGCQGNRGGA